MYIYINMRELSLKENIMAMIVVVILALLSYLLIVTMANGQIGTFGKIMILLFLFVFWMVVVNAFINA